MNVTLLGKRVFADVINDIEIRRLFWNVWVDPKCHHKCHYKREAEGGYIDRRTKGNVKTEAEKPVMKPQAKEAKAGQQLLETKRKRYGMGFGFFPPDSVSR